MQQTVYKVFNVFGCVLCFTLVQVRCASLLLETGGEAMLPHDTSQLSFEVGHGVPAALDVVL